MKSNVALIGMPSCGKTTIGMLLQDELQKEFIDVDEVIVQNANSSIPYIFETQGETGFRKMETEATLQCSKMINKIISTGGGVIKNKINIDYLKESSVIVFIDRDLENLITYDPNRPLSSSKEAVTKLYNERYPLYTKYADIIVKNNGDIKDTVKEIISMIQKEELL